MARVTVVLMHFSPWIDLLATRQSSQVFPVYCCLCLFCHCKGKKEGYRLIFITRNRPFWDIYIKVFRLSTVIEIRVGTRGTKKYWVDTYICFGGHYMLSIYIQNINWFVFITKNRLIWYIDIKVWWFYIDVVIRLYQGFVVKIWWSCAVLKIRIGTMGTEAHWVNPSFFWLSLHIGYIFT